MQRSSLLQDTYDRQPGTLICKVVNLSFGTELGRRQLVLSWTGSLTSRTPFLPSVWCSHRPNLCSCPTPTTQTLPEAEKAKAFTTPGTGTAPLSWTLPPFAFQNRT